MTCTCFRLQSYASWGPRYLPIGYQFNREQGFDLVIATYMEDMHVVTFPIETIVKTVISAPFLP